jgi:hypothetical protein
MRTDHSLKVAVIPYPDGSFIIEFSYWTPLESGHFELRSGRTIAPHLEGVAKVFKSLLPYAGPEYKPKSGQSLSA